MIQFTCKLTTKLVKDIEKKELKEVPKNWDLLTESFINVNHNATCVLTGKINNITVIDFDDKAVYNKLINEHPELKTYKTIETHKGFHVYCMYDARVLTTTNYIKSVDIRNDKGFIFAPPTSYTLLDGSTADYIDLGGSIQSFPLWFTKEIKEVKKVKKEVKEVKEVKINELESIIYLIPADDYHVWIKVALCLKTIDAFELFDAWSATSDKYGNVKETWDSLQPTDLSIATIYYFAKQYNPIQFCQLTSSQLGTSDLELGELVIKLSNQVIQVKGIFYILDGVYWKKSTDREIRKHCVNVLRNYCKTMHETVLDDKTYRILATIMQNISNNGTQKSICEQFYTFLHDSKIIMDNYPYMFCFNNCAFDLRTNKQIKITREHYITQFTDYDYVKSSDNIEPLIRSIFPLDDDHAFYMSVLRSGMIGLPSEMFILANGSGGNGKGVIHDLYKEMLDCYFYKGNILTLTDKIKSGANPEMANMHMKRFVLFSEPDDNSSLRLGQLKDITGGGEINARGLYSSDTQCKILATVCCECNKKPSLNGQVGDSILRRFRNLHFKSTFTDDKEKLTLPNYFPKNAQYKTDDFKRNMRCALFDYLLRFNYTEIYTPDSIRIATKKYLCDADAFTSWLDDNYEVTDDSNDFVKISEMLDMYKETMKFGSREFKAMTKKPFMDLLEKNFKWSIIYNQNYKARHQAYDIDLLNVIINVKRIVHE